VIKQNDIDQYFEAEIFLYEYFGYTGNQVFFAVNDMRDEYWFICEKEGYLRHAFTEKDLYEKGEYYEEMIDNKFSRDDYIFKTKAYTMICIYVETEDPRFLETALIFDNEKER